MNYNLNHFVNAHSQYYKEALIQIKNGKKKTHWIWYIFPQIKGLGDSEISKRYSIIDREEAKAFYNHPILGKHLKEVFSELLKYKNKKSIMEIMGNFLDALKVKSSATLFYVATLDPLFKEVIDTFFFNSFDFETIRLLKNNIKSYSALK